MQLMIWLIGEYSRKYKMNSLFLHKSIITLLSFDKQEFFSCD